MLKRIITCGHTSFTFFISRKSRRICIRLTNNTCTTWVSSTFRFSDKMPSLNCLTFFVIIIAVSTNNEVKVFPISKARVLEDAEVDETQEVLHKILKQQELILNLISQDWDQRGRVDKKQALEGPI